MKKSHIGIMGLVLICCSLSLFSCVNEEDENCTKRYIVAKTADSNSDTIKGQVVFYVFDENNLFIKPINAELDKEVVFDQPAANKYTIVCFGYAPETEKPVLETGTNLKDVHLALNATVVNADTIATSPYDLFHGTLSIHEESKNLNTCWIKRKVAALTIITHHLQSSLNTNDTDFDYVVRRTHKLLNFSGTYEGDKVVYKPDTYFNADNKDFIASTFYTYPSNKGEGLSIDIYKADKRIATYNPTLDNIPITLEEGKHTTVWIDFNNEGNDAAMTVICKIEDWNKQYINGGFN